MLALLSEDFEDTYLFENILISDDKEQTIVPIPQEIKGKIKAFVLNQGEFAYGIFQPD